MKGEVMTSSNEELFPGFGVSGYRSLSGEPQWLSLDRRVTVVLGENNSGKSNVLRLIAHHLASIAISASGGAPLDNFNLTDDSPGFEQTPFRVDWPIKGELARNGRLVLSLTSPGGLNGQLEFSNADGAALTTANPQVEWGTLSSQLTGLSGGEFGQDAKRVVDALRKSAHIPPPVTFVPALRSMSPETTEAHPDWDFGGRGFVARLSKLLSPAARDTASRQVASAFRESLRYLFADDTADVEVHDGSTLNVQTGGKWFPLSAMGTGTENAILILLAAFVYRDRLLCIEEPDAHLHPTLQRRLIRVLNDAPVGQIVLATHSAHMIDEGHDTVITVRKRDERSELTAVPVRDLFPDLQALGYRASDLLQVNSLIWVEGPSDRIYLLHWMRAVAPELTEGVDFGFVLYGGSLLAHLSADPDGTDDALIKIWRINQNSWLVADSDSGLLAGLKPAVTRLQNEIQSSDRGGMWTTDGYCIENYVEYTTLSAAVKTVHPTANLREQPKTKNPLQALKKPDKVRIALAIAQQEAPPNVDVLDLRQRVEELVAFIQRGRGQEI
jgi:predicted ATPase